MRDELSQGLRQFDETGVLTKEVSEIINQLPLSTVFSMKPSTPVINTDKLICTACPVVVDILTAYIRTHSPEDISELLSSVCTLATPYDEEVCSGVINLNLVSDFHS
jgi:hypothetical protein